jgi:hypothetical protein
MNHDSPSKQQLLLSAILVSTHSSQQGKVRLNFHLFHLIAFLFMYFSIKQSLNYFIQPYQCTI